MRGFQGPLSWFRGSYRYWDKAQIESFIAAVYISWADENDVPLYCGEFGCYEKTPQAIRLAWYRDIIQTFVEHDIAWANWDYKGSFGIVTVDGQDTGIAQVLLA